MEITNKIPALDIKILAKDLSGLAALFIAFSLPFAVLLNSYIIVFFSLSTILFAVSNRIFVKDKLLTILLVASPYLITLLSIIYSDNIKEAMHHVEVKLAMLILPLTLAFQAFETRFIKKILVFFLIATSAAAVVCIAYVFNKLNTTGDPLSAMFTYPYSYENFSVPIRLHTTYFSIYIVFSLGILYQLLPSVRSVIFKILVVLLAFLLVFSLFQLASRIAIVIFVLSIVGLIVYNLFKRSTYPVIIVLCVSLVLVVSLAYQVPFLRHRFFAHTASDFNSDPNNSSRVSRWKCALTVLKKNWLIGVGTGDASGKLLECYKENEMEAALGYKYNAHNEYLAMALRSGIIGLLIFLGCIGFSLMVAIRTGNGLFLFFVAIVSLTFLTESVLSVQKGVIFFAFFNSLFIFEKRQLKGGSINVSELK
jgi:O-antigen ligase